MDYSKGWHEGMSLEDTKNLAYWERNALALMFATRINQIEDDFGFMSSCGWYYDTDNNWEGWKRVISIEHGSLTFHIPDDFDLGDLPEIKPNWNGNSTEQKWDYVKEQCGVK